MTFRRLTVSNAVKSGQRHLFGGSDCHMLSKIYTTPSQHSVFYKRNLVNGRLLNQYEAHVVDQQCRDMHLSFERFAPIPYLEICGVNNSLMGHF